MAAFRCPLLLCKTATFFGSEFLVKELFKSHKFIKLGAWVHDDDLAGYRQNVRQWQTLGQVASNYKTAPLIRDWPPVSLLSAYTRAISP